MSRAHWPRLFTKTAAGHINFWEIWTEGADVCTRWGKVGTDKPLEDRYTAAGKNVGRKNETSPEEQASKEAEAKFDKQIRLKYVHSVQEAESNINIKPMRAYVWDEKRAKKVKWPVSIQPKFNGVRCMAYNIPDKGVRLMSRGGKDYLLPHIQGELAGRLQDGWCLDGELYVHGTSLQTIRSYIETPQEGTLSVQFVVYDRTRLPPDKANWMQRMDCLNNWFAGAEGLEYTVLAQTLEANSLEDVTRFHNMWVSLGYEGAMIRTMKGTYRLGSKSVDLLKYKMFQDAEFKVVGWGVGKDGVVKYVCEQEEGLTFEVRPMGTEEERAELLKTADADVGKLLTVKFQERSDDNIPIFPVGVALRPEKDLD